MYHVPNVPMKAGNLVFYWVSREKWKLFLEKDIFYYSNFDHNFFITFKNFIFKCSEHLKQNSQSHFRCTEVTAGIPRAGFSNTGKTKKPPGMDNN